MAEENDSVYFEEKAKQLLVQQLDTLPEEFDTLQQYLKTSRHMLRYYFGEAGIHFEQETQGKLEVLVTKSDYLVLEFSRLEFQVRQWANQAEKRLINQKPFTINETEAQEFQNSFNGLQKETRELCHQTQTLLYELCKTTEKRAE